MVLLIGCASANQKHFSALISQTSVRAETSGGVSKCGLFSQTTIGEAGYFVAKSA